MTSRTLSLSFRSRFISFLLGVLALCLSGVYFYQYFPGKQPFIDVIGPNWMDTQVEREFARFEKTGITKKMMESTWKKCHNKDYFRRYKVVNSKVYGPKGKIRNLLEAMTQIYPVPDVDFIYFQEDIVRESFFKSSRKLQNNAPILVSAKKKGLDQVVLFIDWYYDIADQKSGWNQTIRAINENVDRWSWDQKIEKGFWRGTPFDGYYTLDNWTRHPRGRLVSESKFQVPDLIDADFVKYPPFFTIDPEAFKAKFGVAPFIAPENQIQYKYQIDTDGVTCTFQSLQWKLLSGCLTLKQDSPDTMWFYSELIPWKHYVPLRRDLSDVVEKIQWAKSHDEEARLIGQRAREFALTHVMPEYILQYCYKVLLKYASLQKFKPVVTAKDLAQEGAIE